MGMKIPDSAADPGHDNESLPDANEAYIMNPYPGKELLTRHEALNAINALSGMLLIDGNKRNKQSKEED